MTIAIRAGALAVALVLLVQSASAAPPAPNVQTLALAAADTCASPPSNGARGLMAVARSRGFPAFVADPTRHPAGATFEAGGMVTVADPQGRRPAVLSIQQTSRQEAGQRRVRTITCGFLADLRVSSILLQRFTQRFGAADGAGARGRSIWVHVVVGGVRRPATRSEMMLTQTESRDALLRRLGPGSQLIIATVESDFTATRLAVIINEVAQDRAPAK